MCCHAYVQYVVMLLRCVWAHCLVFHQGDNADAFYIVYSGSVAVYVRNEHSNRFVDRHNSRRLRRKKRRKILKRNYVQNGHAHNNKSLSPWQPAADDTREFTKVATIAEGQSFGELGLLSERTSTDRHHHYEQHRQRKASIVANEWCTLLKLKEKYFIIQNKINRFIKLKL